MAPLASNGLVDYLLAGQAARAASVSLVRNLTQAPKDHLKFNLTLQCEFSGPMPVNTNIIQQKTRAPILRDPFACGPTWCVDAIRPLEF